MYPMFPMMNNWFNQYTAIQAPRFNSFQQYATQNSNSSNVLAYGGQGNLYAQMNSPFNVVNTYGAGNSLIYANGANLVANLGAGNDFFYAYNRALSNFYYPNAAQNVATGGQDVLVAQNTTSYNVNTGAGNDALFLGHINNVQALNINAGDDDDALLANIENQADFTLDMGSGNDVAAVNIAHSGGTLSLGHGNDAALIQATGSQLLVDAIGLGHNTVAVEALDSDLVYLGGIEQDDLAVVATNSTVALDGNSGDDNIALSLANADGLASGGNGDDTIALEVTDIRSTGFVDGGNGNDTITVEGNSGTAQVNGGRGDDTIRVGGVAMEVVVDDGLGNDLAEFLAEALGSTYVFNGGAGQDRYLANAGRGIGATYNLIGGGADLFTLTNTPYASEFTVHADSEDTVRLNGSASNWRMVQNGDARTYTNYRNGNIVYLIGQALVEFATA
ncbi:MAG: hypothetical protein KC474_10035 [Cyanobacteria bacterium HKST-UBA04]|nr:hypothetical protein [Cyanobacteria bacterium HKST-UBA04]MCA9840570.1 hypothetical protein [Cyanobacteria bacterium HKST-UBA03]